MGGRGKASSIFSPKSEKTKVCRLTVPVSLMERVDAINEELGKKDAEQKFDHQAILTEALEKAVTKAERELGGMQESERSSSRTPAQPGTGTVAASV